MTRDYRKLIEEAREYAGNDSIPMPLALRLADDLESVLAELDEERRAHDRTLGGYAALAAQIAAAKAWDEWRNARMYGDEGTPYSNGAKAATTALIRILSADPAEILREHDARVRAESLRQALDGSVLMMGDDGVTVYDSREHYERGLPRPKPIREWLADKADGIEKGADDDHS